MFKAAALRDLRERYKDDASKSLFAQAAALDPRTKDFGYVKDAVEREEKRNFACAELVKSAMQLKVLETSIPSDNLTTVSESEPPKKRAKGEAQLLQLLGDDADDDDIQSHTADKGPMEITETQIRHELELYYKLPKMQMTGDPLAFWKASVATYPILARLAKRFLAIPATSVKCERLFSTAGNIVTDLRNRLEPENLRALLFLNKNSDLL